MKLTAREYQAKLYHQRDDPVLQTLKDFLDLLIHENDVSRRKCTPETLKAYQGETLAYSLLLKCLTSPPPELQEVKPQTRKTK